MKPSKPRLALPCSRRSFLRVSGLGLGVVAAGSGSLLVPGCAVSGEHDLDTTLTLKPNSGGAFGGWTDIGTSAAPSGVSATLVRASMTAPEGLRDLTFFKSILGSGVDASTNEQVPLVSSNGFPKNDTIGVFDVLYDGDLRRFIDEDAQHIHILWKGVVDMAGVTIPPGGAVLDVLVTINVD